ncbi:MAG: TonB family protein [Candidatus Omnitrophica bacterium]|nr:TonB family protein [Candidatus Omnitrophota bacterium]
MKKLFKMKVLVVFSIVFLALSGWSFEVKDLDANRVELKDIKLLNYGYYPCWSPDGKKILYSSGNSIYMMNPDGSNKEHIIDGYNATWSPDGKRIAYKKKKPTRIAILDLKTKKEYIIYDPGYDRSRRDYLGCRTEWTRDGEKLFFVRARRTWIINLDDLSERESAVRPNRVNRNISHPLFSIYVNLHYGKYFPSGFSLHSFGTKSGARRILDGIWVENKKSGNSFAIRLLNSYKLREALYTFPELSPDLTKLVFVKEELRSGEKIIHIAKIGRSSTSNIKTYEVAMGLNDGIKEKDILIVYEARINPLNNKLIGYNKDKIKGTVLVESVTEGKCRVRSYLVAENFGRNSVAMKKNQALAYLKDLSSKEALPDTRLIARRVGENTYSYVNENAVMSLVEELNHISTNGYKQIFLFEVLGNLGDERAVGAIIRKIENESWYSLYACAALLKIRSPRGIEFAVKHICQNVRSGFGQGTDNFVKALGELKDPKVLTYYIQELRREADTVKLSPKHFIVVTIKKAEETLDKLEPSKSSQVKSEATEFIKGIPFPKLVKKVDPVYPRIARKAGLEGKVILAVTIDSRGRVVNATAKDIKGAGRISLVAKLTISRAAVNAVKQWVYEPMVIDGKQTKGMTFTVTVPFKLK